jgi:Tol biopolymer transport system component
MRRFAMYCGAVTVALGAGTVAAGPLITERINVNPTTGAQADGISYSPVLSADGCVVAFVSQSGTLAPASYGLTTSSPPQVYAVNRCVTPHTLELVSVTNNGTAAADRACQAPNISADGRYVAFVTAATNLPVSGSGQNGSGAVVFVRDRTAQTTLSPLQAWRPTPQNNGGIGVDGTAAIRYMSADASRFAFDFRSPPSVQQNFYVVNFSGGVSTLQPICPALDNACLAGTSDYLTISAGGSTVLLQSTYPFVAGGGSGLHSLYSYDVATTASTLVSVNAIGMPANADVDPLSDISVSGDGHLVAFSTDTATNFPGNTSNTLVLKNVTTGAVTLISASSDGTPVKIGYGIALPQLSADGNRLAFTAENQLVPHNYQVGDDAVVADLSLRRLGSACISASGSYGLLGCDGVTISADGKWVAFRSNSNNLVPNDTNGEPDIFVVALDPAVDDVFAYGFEP